MTQAMRMMPITRAISRAVRVHRLIVDAELTPLAIRIAAARAPNYVRAHLSLESVIRASRRAARLGCGSARATDFKLTHYPLERLLDFARAERYVRRAMTAPAPRPHAPTFGDEVVRCVDCGAVITGESWARELCPARTAPLPITALEPDERGTVTLTCDRGPIYGHRAQPGR